MLAESLGDRTLSVAYWLPERKLFVDEPGHVVRMPEPGSGRSWTAVERDGRRVAAIIHDAELATGPELVNAAAAGAALAIDNERLKANLRARVEELRVSRVRIVEAQDTRAAASSATSTTAPSSSSSRSRSTCACSRASSTATRRRPRPSTRCRRSSRPRSPSCASSPAASTR